MNAKNILGIVTAFLVFVTTVIVLSPTVDLANPAANSRGHHTQVVRHPAPQTAQFQEQEDLVYDALGLSKMFH